MKTIEQGSISVNNAIYEEQSVKTDNTIGLHRELRKKMVVGKWNLEWWFVFL